MSKCRMVLLWDVPNLENLLPAVERWALRDHPLEVLSWHGPSLDFYVSYRVVAPPPDLYSEVMRYGYYNYRVTIQVYNEDPPLPTRMWTFLAPIPNPTRPGPVDKEKVYTTEFHGRPEGPHPMVLSYVPLVPTQDFMGSGLGAYEKTILRWLIVFKYPKGVPVEEVEKWYVDIHSKEVMQQPGLTRYFSYHCMEFPGRPNYPWHRVSEQWYENFDGWRESVIDSPPKYTKPPWAKYDKYPFFEPNVDFVSTFILERPTNDFLRDYMGYYPSSY